METVRLNNDVEMPLLGLGTMQVKNLGEIIPAAIDAGYRLIDTAANYDNEQEVGNAVRKSGIARSQLFLTSKMQILRNGAAHTARAVEQSLKNLGTDYLDLDLCQYFRHKKLKGYADFFNSSSSYNHSIRSGVFEDLAVGSDCRDKKFCQRVSSDR